MDFGMYKPDRFSRNDFKELKEKETWNLAEKIYLKYRKKWGGPKIDVYIFPSAGGGPFSRHSGKSGVSFANMIFLFLPSDIGEDEIEALFVHEYHHACRINSQKKTLEEFTLLDSIILEGLAEHAVEIHCGKKFRGSWCSRYSKDEIRNFWDKLIKIHLKLKKNERLHQKILYGERPYPPLLGYAAGYEIVRGFREKKSFSTKLSFSAPSEYFVDQTLYKLES
ncbi:DUF2268 domain-containing protein [Cytobacillus oceanisediminis]|uniref:DUF2268 domain-containing protein n=1 Tax=Cytobacillus oceanisediminis 2691 TaxID=1196031 RepID=A0A169FIM6_9BACI|nr:DUF2268 domain-containing putative Zn-dependent protease [Cytobacillus oceanisediminis]AND38965.1 hypothetical protein A361_07495 [Cytobacillus oceanisediminis 2691]